MVVGAVFPEDVGAFQSEAAPGMILVVPHPAVSVTMTLGTVDLHHGTLQGTPLLPETLAGINALHL